jgi:multidrug transporter EmrE-like cation transporter
MRWLGWTVNAGTQTVRDACGLPDSGVGRGRLLVGASLWLVLPLCAVLYQIAAKKASVCRVDSGAGSWLSCVVHTPWLWVMVACDIAGFVAWMHVLGRMQLSAAFPMTALSYVLVIAASWWLFGEALTASRLIGSALIMTGVLLLGRTSEASP